MDTYALPNAFVLALVTLVVATVLAVIAEIQVARRDRD